MIQEPLFEIKGFYEDTLAGLELAKQDMKKIVQLYIKSGYDDSLHMIMIQRIVSTLYIPKENGHDPFNVVFMYSDLEKEMRKLLSDECDSD
jgi:hypothetical protein